MGGLEPAEDGQLKLTQEALGNLYKKLKTNSLATIDCVSGGAVQSYIAALRWTAPAQTRAFVPVATDQFVGRSARKRRIRSTRRRMRSTRR